MTVEAIYIANGEGNIVMKHTRQKRLTLGKRVKYRNWRTMV